MKYVTLTLIQIFIIVASLNVLVQSRPSAVSAILRDWTRPGEVQDFLNQRQKLIVVFKNDCPIEEIFNHINDLVSKFELNANLGNILHRYNFGSSDSNVTFAGYAGYFHPLIVNGIKQSPWVDYLVADDSVGLTNDNEITNNTSSDVNNNTDIPLNQIKPSNTTENATNEDDLSDKDTENDNNEEEAPILAAARGHTNQVNGTWNLSRIWRRRSNGSVYYRYNSRAGTGVDIYIIDSGIYRDHNEFQGDRVSTGITFTEDGSNDLNGHGSHVAGIAAGRWFGVAKKARLIPVKVLNASGRTTWSSIISAIQWVVNEVKRTGRRSVINMSISGGRNQAVNDAIAMAIRAGIHVVVAAGNKNADSCSFSPSSAPGVISVGSVNVFDAKSTFSNIGKCVTIQAPGESIMSAGLSSESAVAVMSGTSMASPHVAGAVAVILSQKNFTPAQMQSYLLRKSTKNVVTGLNDETTKNLLYLPTANVN